MKYIVCDYKNGDLFTSEFDNLDQAISSANKAWNSLTSVEQKNRTDFYLLESVNPDIDATDHFDGNIIIDFKKIWTFCKKSI